MTFTYKDKIYPEYIKNGNAVEYIEPIAKQFCQGEGLDIGGFMGWTLKGAIPVNIANNSLKWTAYKLPQKKNGWDYIASFHCLEHLENPISALEYWIQNIKREGVLFISLPHPDMEYWLPVNNRKHLHFWYPWDMEKIFQDLGLINILHSERDMYWSFSVVGQKR